MGLKPAENQKKLTWFTEPSRAAESNRPMTQQSTIARAILRAATLVFFLNTAMVYGNCCVEAPAAAEPGTAAEPSATLPCHHFDDTDHIDDSDSRQMVPVDSEDCCLLCISMLGSTEPLRNATLISQEISVREPALALATGVDPPFRPPISNLS